MNESTAKRERVSDARRAQIGRAKRARTRKELVSAAFNVFAEKGFDAPVVADFIAASGVSRGTFYNYFLTREEILAAVADDSSGLAGELERGGLISGETVRRIADASGEITSVWFGGMQLTREADLAAELTKRHPTAG